MDRNISGEDIALIEREFEDAIADMRDNVRILSGNLKKMIDNFSEIEKYWATEASVGVVEKVHNISDSALSSQEKIKNYCNAILSSVGSGEMLDFISQEKGLGNE